MQRLEGGTTPDAFVSYAGFARHATVTWQIDTAFSGATADGCAFSGQFGPDADGRLYALQVSTIASEPSPENPDAASCVGERCTGIGYPQTGTSVVIMVATNAREDDSFAATVPARID